MIQVEKEEYFFKILMVGNHGVGKTSLSYTFSEKEYDSNCTIGIDFQTKILQINGENVKIQVWDQVGAERFRSLSQIHYRGISGALLTYDITDKYSFNEVIRWKQDIEMFSPQNVQIALVGNKSDLRDQRKIAFDEGQSLANSLHIPIFVETSAKDKININKVFLQLIMRMIEKIGKRPQVVNVTQSNSKTGWCF